MTSNKYWACLFAGVLLILSLIAKRRGLLCRWYDVGHGTGCKCESCDAERWQREIW